MSMINDQNIGTKFHLILLKMMVLGLLRYIYLQTSLIIPCFKPGDRGVHFYTYEALLIHTYSTIINLCNQHMVLGKCCFIQKHHASHSPYLNNQSRHLIFLSSKNTYLSFAGQNSGTR